LLLLCANSSSLSCILFVVLLIYERVMT
jgi:hypothetical protein